MLSWFSKSVLTICGLGFVQVMVAQTDRPALVAEAEQALAKAFVPQGQPCALAISKVQQKAFFRFYEVAENHRLSQPFERFYSPPTPPTAKSSPQELHDAARHLSKLGYAAEADRYFEQYLKKEPKAGSYGLYERAQNAMLAGNYRLGLELATKAYNKRDADVKIWASAYNFVRAICAAQLGDAKTAEIAFANTNDHLRTMYSYRLFQDGAYARQGTAAEHQASAAENLRSGNTYEAYRDAFRAVQCDPDHLPALEILYQIENAADGKYNPLHNWASHRRMTIRRLKNEPTPPPFGLSPEQRNEFLDYFLAVGQEAYDRGDFEWALIYANEAVVGFPDRAGGYVLRARALYSQKAVYDLKLASWLDATKALQFDPRSGLAYNLRGLVLVHLRRDFPAAIAEFTQGIAVDTQEYRLFENRAFVYTEQGERQLAYADLDQATQLNRRDFNLFWKKGLLALELQDYARAAPALETALELNDARPWGSLEGAMANGNISRALRRELIKAHDALGQAELADAHHQYLLENHFDLPDTQALAARNPRLVEEYARITALKKQVEQLKTENTQQRHTEEFLALAAEELQNEESFNGTVQRKIEHARAIDLGEITFLGELVLLYSARIDGLKQRLGDVEPYLQEGWLAPSTRANAVKVHSGMKTALATYEREKLAMQRKIVELRKQ